MAGIDRARPRRRMLEDIRQPDAGPARAADRAQPPWQPVRRGGELAPAVAGAFEHGGDRDGLEALAQPGQRPGRGPLDLAVDREGPAFGIRRRRQDAVVADEERADGRQRRIELLDRRLGIQGGVLMDVQAGLGAGQQGEFVGSARQGRPFPFGAAAAREKPRPNRPSQPRPVTPAVRPGAPPPPRAAPAAGPCRHWSSAASRGRRSAWAPCSR